MVYSKIQVFLKTQVTLVALFFAALGLRLANLWIMNINDPYFLNLRLDHARYDSLAILTLNQGFWRDYAFFQEPLYPYILATIYSIFGHSYIAVFIIQSILASLSCALLYLIGKSLFDNRTGLLAAIFLVFYSPDIFYSSLLTKVPFSIFFLLLSIYLLIRFRENNRYRNLFLSGIFIGTAAATRGNFLILIPLFLLYIFTISKNKGFKKGIPCIFMLIGFFLSTSPWTIHNYIVDNDFVLITSAGGPSLFLGNNRQSVGTYTNLSFLRPSPKYERTDFTNEAFKRTGNYNLKPSEVSSFWYKESFAYMKKYPKHFANLLWTKVGLFFNYYEIPDNRDIQFQKRYSFIIQYNPVVYGLLAPLAICGLLYSLRDWRKYWFLASIVTVYSIGALAFFIFSRYRVPIVPVMLLFSSYFIFIFKDKIMQKKSKSLIILTILLICTCFFTSRTIIDVDFYRYHSQLDLGYSYMESGKYDLAINEIKSAMPFKPKSKRAFIILSDIYLKNGQYDEAKKNARSFLKIKPNDPWAKKYYLD